MAFGRVASLLTISPAYELLGLCPDMIARLHTMIGQTARHILCAEKITSGVCLCRTFGTYAIKPMIREHRVLL